MLLVTLGLTVGGGCLIIAMRHVARIMLGDLRPIYVGANTNSDLAYPRPEIVTFVVLAAVVLLGLVGLLARAGRRHPHSRLGAAALLVFAVTVLLVRTVDAEPRVRCSEDVYAEYTTCVEGSVATRADLATLLGPTVVVVASLTWDTRRRSASSKPRRAAAC